MHFFRPNRRQWLALAAAAQLGTTVASFFTLTSLLWGLKHLA